MKLSYQMIINKPVKEVWDYFDDEKNLPKWLENLKSFEHVSGEAGSPGAVSHHNYLENGKEFTLVETIKERVPYEKFTGTMNHKTMNTDIEHYFTDLQDGRTSISCNMDVKFNTFVFKLLGPFMKGMMSKRMMGDFNRLKDCIENNK